MRKDADFRAAEFCGIHDAGVNEFIQNDDVRLTQQGADRALGRGIAAGEDQSGLGFLELGECGFQFVEGGKRAANQSGCAAPAPNFSMARIAASLRAG